MDNLEQHVLTNIESELNTEEKSNENNNLDIALSDSTFNENIFESFSNSDSDFVNEEISEPVTIQKVSENIPEHVTEQEPENITEREQKPVSEPINEQVLEPNTVQDSESVIDTICETVSLTISVQESEPVTNSDSNNKTNPEVVGNQKKNIWDYFKLC